MPGVADLILLHARTFHALEIKRDAKARVSPAQRRFIAAVKVAGGFAEIDYGLNGSIKILENWGLLRGKMQA